MRAITFAMVGSVLALLGAIGCAALPAGSYQASAELVVEENLADQALEYVRELCDQDPADRVVLLQELNQVAQPSGTVISVRCGPTKPQPQ